MIELSFWLTLYLNNFCSLILVLLLNCSIFIISLGVTFELPSFWSNTEFIVWNNKAFWSWLKQVICLIVKFVWQRKQQIHKIYRFDDSVLTNIVVLMLCSLKGISIGTGSEYWKTVVLLNSSQLLLKDRYSSIPREVINSGEYRWNA